MKIILVCLVETLYVKLLNIFPFIVKQKYHLPLPPSYGYSSFRRIYFSIVSRQNYVTQAS